MKIVNILLMISSLWVVVSCGNYTEIKSAFNQKNMGSGEVVTNTKLDFATIKTEILGPKCISCHTGRHAAYDSYAVVKASLNSILERVSTQNPALRMPKDAGPLNSQEMAMLREWVQAGAPEFSKKEPVPEEKEEILIGFEEIKTKILTPNCVACHTHFNDYEPVKKVSGSLLSLVLSDKMPFPKRKGQEVVPLSKEDKDLLMAWVGQGAPEFAGVKSMPLPEAELKPNWISLRNNVFGPKCILCHNSFGPRAPTFMGTHTEIRSWFAKNPKLFNFENPNDSHFVGAIIGRVDDDEFYFDTMPFNSSFDDVPTDISSVTEEELTVIEKWIELKLPFNEEDL